MSNDGATQTVLPKRALETILGGKDQPTEEETVSREELEAKIRLASMEPDSYDDCSLAIARVIVEAVEKYPNLRSVPMEAEYLRDVDGETVWFEDRERPVIHIRSGMHDVLKEIFPDEQSPERKVMSEMTGFMWGWAYNAAARVLGMSARPNPAIVEL